MEGFEGMRMRRDPEAVRAYRELLAAIGSDGEMVVAGMSDELVIENVERVASRLLAVVKGLERMRPAMERAVTALTNVAVTMAGVQLVAETELDLQLRAQLDADSRLLELFDDDHECPS